VCGENETGTKEEEGGEKGTGIEKCWTENQLGTESTRPKTERSNRILGHRKRSDDGRVRANHKPRRMGERTKRSGGEIHGDRLKVNHKGGGKGGEEARRGREPIVRPGGDKRKSACPC